MAAAERIVRHGGIIILAAACGDGVPGHGAFARLLDAARTPDDLVEAAGPELDVWQAQVLGRVLQRAEVHLYSEGLSGAEMRRAQLHPVADLSTAVAGALARCGQSARLAVLPEGPLTVATMAAPATPP
jgi:nickel-dependent lactate racemase